MPDDRHPLLLEFADFELDPRRHELRRQGRRVPLQEQPYRILACLLERPGEIVSREELRARLWPSGTYVEFEKSINVAVMKLRDALGDAAEAPRFIETLPRLGYRFVAPVIETGPPEALSAPKVVDAPDPVEESPPSPAAPPAAPPRVARRRVPVAALLVGAIAIAAALALAAWRSRAESGRPKVRSLAVLPFADQSPQAGEEYLAAGLTEELITRLAQIGTLKVTSRTSSEALRDSKATVPVIARRLGVDAVVEGSIARFGSRVRISAQLVHGATDKHLWAHRYEEDERDLLNLQNTIARDIAREIAATLRPAEEKRLARRQNVDPEAYREYLQGRYLLARRSIEGFLGALRHFRRAIALDDTFALGHLGLAMTFEGMHSLSVLDGAAPRGPRGGAAGARARSRPRRRARRARGRPDERVPLRRSRGRVRARDRPVAEQRICALQYSHLLIELGRHDEALREAKAACELDPLSPLLAMSFVWSRYMARDYPAAVAAGRRALELDPNYPETLQLLARVHAAAGDAEASFAAYAAWARSVGFTAADQVALDRRYRKEGLPGVYRFLLELEARDEEETGEVWPARRARLHALLGEADAASHWLEQAAAGRQRVVGLGDPAFDNLRRDPGFDALLRRLGQPPPPPAP